MSELIAVGSVRIEDGPPTGVANYAGCASRSEFAGTAAYGYCASKSRYVWKMPLVLATAPAASWSPTRDRGCL